MKIKFNKGKIIKLLSLVTAGIVLYVGSHIAFNSSKKEENTPKIRKVVLSEDKCTELTIDGTTYTVPYGFDHLEVVNGTVYAVNNYLREGEFIVTKDEKGNETLVAPEGYYVIDGKPYTEIVQYGTPDTIRVEVIDDNNSIKVNK